MNRHLCTVLLTLVLANWASQGAHIQYSDRAEVRIASFEALHGAR